MAFGSCTVELVGERVDFGYGSFILLQPGR